MKTTTEVPQILTSQEAAEYLRTTKSSLFRLIKGGKIKAARIGKNYRLSKKELDRFVEQGEEIED
jgi:excisionase family DNA binding protein